MEAIEGKDLKAIGYQTLMQAASQYIAESMPLCERPEAVADLIRPMALGLDQEVFWVLHLTAKNAVIRIVQATVGLADRTQVHPREVFREAIRDNACRVILAHNHPSGDATPSSQDISATRQLVEAGKILGIEVLDHIVIGVLRSDGVRSLVSMREQNLLCF